MHALGSGSITWEESVVQIHSHAPRLKAVVIIHENENIRVCYIIRLSNFCFNLSTCLFKLAHSCEPVTFWVLQLQSCFKVLLLLIPLKPPPVVTHHPRSSCHGNNLPRVINYDHCLHPLDSWTMWQPLEPRSCLVTPWTIDMHILESWPSLSSPLTIVTSYILKELRDPERNKNIKLGCRGRRR